MRAAVTLLVVVALVMAGCGDDGSGDEESRTSQPPAQEAEDGRKTGKATPPEETETGTPAARKGTRIKLGDSEFGTMLFGSNDQAIYIFQNDPRGETVCYGECAAAWPPVLTKGEPRALAGVKQTLLGTVERRDGTRQVTYAGKPLYFYAHEAPGEVRCHNINLNGGLWWAVGPDGRRLP